MEKNKINAESDPSHSLGFSKPRIDQWLQKCFHGRQSIFGTPLVAWQRRQNDSCFRAMGYGVKKAPKQVRLSKFVCIHLQFEAFCSMKETPVANRGDLYTKQCISISALKTDQMCRFHQRFWPSTPTESPPSNHAHCLLQKGTVEFQERRASHGDADSPYPTKLIHNTTVFFCRLTIEPMTTPFDAIRRPQSHVFFGETFLTSVGAWLGGVC